MWANPLKAMYVVLKIKAALRENRHGPRLPASTGDLCPILESCCGGGPCLVRESPDRGGTRDLWPCKASRRVAWPLWHGLKGRLVSGILARRGSPKRKARRKKLLCWQGKERLPLQAVPPVNLNRVHVQVEIEGHRLHDNLNSLRSQHDSWRAGIP